MQRQSPSRAERSTPLRVLASGIGFTEGPLWTSDGRLLVTSASRGEIHELGLDGGAARVTIRVGGRPTGLAEALPGDLWIVSHGPDRPGLLRRRGNSTEQVLTRGGPAPTDCTADRQGRIWFTESSGSPLAGGPAGGRVCRFDPDAGTVVVLVANCLFPNGIGFSPAEDVLHVAETAAGRICSYPVRPDGSLGPARHTDLGSARPDGLTVDERGRVLVALVVGGAVAVLEPDGSPAGMLELPGMNPTSVCLAGPDRRTLVATVPSGGRVVAVDHWDAALTAPAVVR
ncbi:SMP-30/gluconolactonase/LRE family protein [Pseudonocardia sp. GCM10023141]|uniref:SMP-30/gluconolactonase/LRE family protein n=1 Tax=Pseudonocardia sp. GCM10023141 TaxID=3252653 RepID=UPI00360A8DB7